MIRSEFTDEQTRSIIEAFNSHTSITDIAHQFQITRGTVYRILKANGFTFSADKPKHDLVGQKFGFLEVIKMDITSKSKGGVWRAICRCHNCGNSEFDANVQSIMRGACTSCGCRRDQFQKITGERSPNYTGYKEIRGRYWSKLKNKANKRGISFCLSIEDAWALFETQERRCFFSGLPLRFAGNNYNKDQTASLDRLDSSQGYAINNVVWVHKDINIMKGLMSKEYFVSMCTRVSKEQSGRLLSDVDIGVLRGSGTGYGLPRNTIRNR